MTTFNQICEKIFEKDGILYDNSGRPIEINLHDGTGDGFLSRSSARGLGWEIDYYSDAVSLPSDCLRFDLENNIQVDDEPLNHAQVDAIMDFFKTELKENDAETAEYIRTLQEC